MRDAATTHDPGVRAVAEALADVLAERGLIIYATAGPTAARLLNASDVARLLGRKPAWVYAHATELGAIRFGDGPRARIGFELAAIERWKRDHQSRPPSPRGAARRSRRNAMPRTGTLIEYKLDALHQP